MFENVISPPSGKASLLLREEVNIPVDSNSIRVRALVTEAVDMTITAYTLQP